MVDSRATVQHQSDTDPIDWAIVGVVIAAGAWVTAIRTKIKADQVQRDLQAQQHNRLVLHDLRVNLGTISETVGRMRRRIEFIDPKATGTFGAGAFRFRSEVDESFFGSEYEFLLEKLAQIQRLFSQLTETGLRLPEATLAERIRPAFANIDFHANKVLDPKASPPDRIGSAEALIMACTETVAMLESLLQG